LLANLFLPVNVLYVCKLLGKKELAVVINPEQKNSSLASEARAIQLIENYLKIKILIHTPEEIEKKSSITL